MNCRDRRHFDSAFWNNAVPGSRLPDVEVQGEPIAGGRRRFSRGAGGPVPVETALRVQYISDDDPTDELNTGLGLNGTDLEIIDAGGALSVDLSSLQDGVGITTNEADFRYVNVSGDRMSGQLELPVNGLIVGSNQFVTRNGRIEMDTQVRVGGGLWVAGGLTALTPPQGDVTMRSFTNGMTP